MSDETWDPETWDLTTPNVELDSCVVTMRAHPNGQLRVVTESGREYRFYRIPGEPRAETHA